MVNDAGRKEVDAALETLERRIIREYAQAETEVQTKMDTFLKKFEAQDKEFKALVDKGEMDVGKYIKWRQKQILTSTYWRDMRDTLAQDYINVDKIVKHMTGEHVYDVYAMGRNYGAYEVEHRTSLDTSFTLYNHEAVERLLRDDPDLLPMPGETTREAISEGKLKAWNRKQLQSAMTQSILQGEPIDKIAKRVATAVGGMDTKAAIRTARTATTSAESAGRRDSYKRAHNMGIKLKQMWVATLDGRTRHEHRQLDGQTCEVDGKFKINGEEIEYPGDPTAPGYLVYNCRCAMVAVIPGTQLAEEGITGVERDDRLEDMSYEEWKGEHANEELNDDIVRLIGGNGDPEITDDIRDYFLPASTRAKLDEIEELTTYNDFSSYLQTHYGIELDTGIPSLKAEKADESIPAVTAECRKIVTAIDAYVSTFGDDALSNMHKVVLADSDLDVRAAYFFNRIGENDPLAGEIHFQQWGDDGRTIFHELAHAFQDSHKKASEDAITYSEHVIAATGSEGLSAYTGAAKEAYAAEQFADAFGFGFGRGTQEGIDFINKLQRLEGHADAEESTQTEPEFHIAEGTDITATWERRSDQFAFEIEDVINAQGFDGVPRIVDAEEFDRAVAAANGGHGFIAQRTYSGPTQEVVDEYRRQLYEDHWYVDCSTGGAQYGQGMYCAADYTGQLSDGIQTEMQHYIDLNETRLSQNYSGMSVEDRQVALPSIIDELRPDLPADQKAALHDFVTYDTLNDADTISFERAAEARKLLMDNGVNIGQFEFELETYRTHPYANVETLTLDPSAKIITYRELDDLRTYTGIETRLADALDVPTETKKALLAWVESEEDVSSLTGQVRKYAESIEQKTDKLMNMDCGALAAALGYDAIDASGHGQSGSYTVILNRTKVIFRRED